MTIYGHGVLWDPKRNKPAARFVGGELETDDSRVIELAEMAGFVWGEQIGETGETMDPIDGDTISHDYTKDELIELAESRGVEIDKRWGVERLKQAVL